MPADHSFPANPPARHRASVWILAVIAFPFFFPFLMSWKLAVLLGMGLLVLAGWLARQQHVWLRSARVVPGTVTELIRVTGNKGRSSYRPRIRYTTSDGAVHSFVQGYASHGAGLAVGEPVTVAYHDAKPEDLHILTFGQFYGFAVFLAAMGALFVLMGLAFLVGGRYVPAIYLPAPPPPASVPG